MSVAERIACMQDFTKQMQAHRQEIVRLITWEIGKSLADREKEFDRTSTFPKRVINTVYGQGSVVVPLLLGSGKVNALTLIGSSKVADHLKKLSPKAHRLRAILGLDAKNAAILLPDADLELVVKECLLGCAWRREGCPARADTPSSLWDTLLAPLRAGVTHLSSIHLGDCHRRQAVPERHSRWPRSR
jgi:acyl-CoA reductase-like NAD-dependent aldehyde dehydrogenase